MKVQIKQGAFEMADDQARQWIEIGLLEVAPEPKAKVKPEPKPRAKAGPASQSSREQARRHSRAMDAEGVLG